MILFCNKQRRNVSRPGTFLRFVFSFYRSVCSVIIPQRMPNLSTNTTRQEL